MMDSIPAPTSVERPMTDDAPELAVSELRTSSSPRAGRTASPKVTVQTTVRNQRLKAPSAHTSSSFVSSVLLLLSGMIIILGVAIALAYYSFSVAELTEVQQVLILAGVVVVWGGIALVVLRGYLQQVSQTIRSLTQRTEQLGTGDFSKLVDVQSSDEVGRLAAAYNDTVIRLRSLVRTEGERQQELERREELQQNIAEFLNVAMDIANGDFTRRGRVTEDNLGNVIDAINVMVEELGYLLKDVQMVAGAVKGGSEEMLAVTDAIAGQIARQVDEARLAQDEMTEVITSIREMAQNAEVSAQAAGQTLVASDEGQAAVTNTLSGMQNIRREVQTIAKRLKTLGDRSLEISEIVDTISGIAKQTNLLALNAAVEASGAGEAGKRFAIVANEVRKLAKDAAAATGRIEAQISSVQAEVQEVIQSVEDGTREVELGYRVATEAGERLKEIGDISRRAALLAQTIAQDTQIQSQGVEQVGQTITEVASIAERSRQDVAAGRSAAEALQGLSKQLSESLSRFKLEGA
jgi:twitching motility protein PilJ